MVQYEGCPSKYAIFCYNTSLCIENSMNFVRNIDIDLGHIYYKYGCNQSLDSKVINIYLTVCQRVRSTSQIIMLYFQRGVVKILSILVLHKL